MRFCKFSEYLRSLDVVYIDPMLVALLLSSFPVLSLDASSNSVWSCSVPLCLLRFFMPLSTRRYVERCVTAERHIVALCYIICARILSCLWRLYINSCLLFVGIAWKQKIRSEVKKVSRSARIKYSIGLVAIYIDRDSVVDQFEYMY